MNIRRDNISLSPVCVFVAFLVCLFVSFKTQGAILAVLDQELMPVQDAIVSLPMVSTVKTEDKNLPIAVMDQIDRQFVPHVLVIQRGQSVLFPNKDNIRHHVYSFSRPKTFELKLYSGTPSSPVVFDEEGIVVLGCNIHDSMVGFIYIADSPTVFKTDDKGLIDFDQVPENIYIWHERVQGQKWVKRAVKPIYNSDNQRWEVILTLDPVEVESRESRTFKSGFNKRAWSGK